MMITIHNSKLMDCFYINKKDMNKGAILFL